MELSKIIRSALTPCALNKVLQLLKEEKSFGESLCYSQLLCIEGALDDACKMGWGGFDHELASVKDGPMGV